jgi:hypothetical protein
VCGRISVYLAINIDSTSTGFRQRSRLWLGLLVGKNRGRTSRTEVFAGATCVSDLGRSTQYVAI